jgi:alkaline phosphatase D
VTRKRSLLTLVAVLLVALSAWIWLAGSNGVIGDQADPTPAKPGVFRIAFGSCAKQWKPNPMWRAILNCKPDLWIWLGDSVYAATEDMAYLKSQYELQKQNPGYRELMRTCRIIGTWDDNDYGMRNGDGSYPKKAESEQALPRFPGRAQRHQVYKADWFIRLLIVSGDVLSELCFSNLV